jgi:alanine racemase
VTRAVAVPFREAQIDGAALQRNLESIRARRQENAALPAASQVELFVDVGGDAWGHDVAVCVPIFEACGVAGYVVGRESEARAVRALAESAVIVCTQFGAPQDAELIGQLNILWAIRTLADAQRLLADSPIAIAIVVDDGRSPIGLTPTEEQTVRIQAQHLGVTVYRIDAGSVVGAELFGLSETVERSKSHWVGEPVMRLWAPVVGVKTIPGNVGISYGYTYRTVAETRVALISLGYGDGLDRSAGNRLPVFIDEAMHLISGRVSMDAFVVDIGPDSLLEPGAAAVVWGNPRRGEPHVDDAARVLGVHSAELVTRLTARSRRSAMEGESV